LENGAAPKGAAPIEARGFMKKEQLKEVADIFHSKLSKKKQLDVVYNHNKVRDASLTIHQNNVLRNKAMSNNLGLASSKIEEKINTAITRILDIVSDYKKRLEFEKESFDSKYYLAELTACNNTFKSLVYEDGYLIVTTSPITLENIGLGRFEVRVAVNLIDSSPNSFLTINALEPNYAGGGENYPHPHVDGDSLCMGEGYSLICDAAQQGRIEDVFNLAINILSNYNRDSPYHSLDEWEGVRCQRCDCSYDPEECGCCCEICDRSVCDDCASCCDSCGCSVCSEHMTISCGACETHSCNRCSENSSYCQRCDTTLCEDCATTCQVCDETICEECSKSCDSCGDHICKKHESTCNGCESGLCESCEQSCKQCGSTICTKCHDDEKWCCEKEEEKEEEPVTPVRRTRRPRTTS